MITTLYEQIADEIQRQVHEHILRPGDRLPSVRKMSRQKGVSISTVLQAYMQLEDMGMINARPQSGYYVSERLRSLPPEPKIRRFSPSPERPSHVISLVEDLINATHIADFAPLGGAVPSPELLPLAKLSKLFASIARTSVQDISRYEPAAGNLELRRQIALRQNDHNNVGMPVVSPDNVIISCGATEGLNLCLRAVAKPGDTIAVESPCYFGVLRIIEGLGMNALEIPTDPRTGISLDHLAAAMKEGNVQACVLVPNFNNPLGCLMPDINKMTVARLAERYQVPIIEDDIYGDIYFGDKRPKPLQCFDASGLVMLVSSFSKTLSPGLRVGYIVPGHYYQEVLHQKISTSLATSTLPQLVLAKFLQNGGYDHHLRAMRRSLQHQVQKMIQAVGEYFPAGTKVTRPEGGYVLWVELPEHINTVDLHSRALEQKISIAPGSIFSKKQEYEHFIRLNCGYPITPEINAALVTLGALVRSSPSRSFIMNHY